MEEKKNTIDGRRKFLLQTGLAVVAIPFTQVSCQSSKDKPVDLENEDSFEFAFLTDIHIKPEMNAPKGFQMAIDKVNELNRKSSLIRNL